MPFGNVHGVAKLILSERVNQNGLKVVLTGEGADEILAGYPHIKDDLFRYGEAKESVRFKSEGLDALRRQYSHFPGFLLDGKTEDDLEKFAMYWGYKPSMLRTGSARGRLFARVYLPQYSSFDKAARPFTELLNKFSWHDVRAYDVVHRSLALWQATVLPSYILTVLGDRAEMANSVEARVPFLDKNLFSLMRRIPSSMKIANGAEKAILREAMADRVHPSVLLRPKLPFMAPPTKQGQGSVLRTYMGDVFTSEAFSDQPFYCRRKTLKLFDALSAMGESERMEVDRVLIFVLSVAVMQKVFNPCRGLGE